MQVQLAVLPRANGLSCKRGSSLWAPFLLFISENLKSMGKTKKTRTLQIFYGMATIVSSRFRSPAAYLSLFGRWKKIRAEKEINRNETPAASSWRSSYTQPSLVSQLLICLLDQSRQLLPASLVTFNFGAIIFDRFSSLIYPNTRSISLDLKAQASFHRRLRRGRRRLEKKRREKRVKDLISCRGSRPSLFL